MRRSFAAVFAAVLLGGVPVALAVGIHRIVPERANPPASSMAEPLYLPAVEESYSGSLEATVRPTWQPPTSLILQQTRPGVVTSVTMTAGKAIESGSVVYAINGVAVLALHTPAPLYRSLRIGDQGPDVLALEEALTSMGFFWPTPDETYDREADAAVKAWMESLGAASNRPGFDVTSVVWLPDTQFPVAAVHVAVGQQAPGPGEAIAETKPHLESAVIIASGPPADRGVELVLQTGLGKATFLWPGDADGHEITLLGTAAESIAGVLPVDEQDVPARVELQKPLQHVVIPASAVVIGQSGTACAWVRTTDAGGLSRRTIKPGSGGFGGAAIQDGIQPGEDVLANPLAVGVAETCP